MTSLMAAAMSLLVALSAWTCAVVFYFSKNRAQKSVVTLLVIAIAVTASLVAAAITIPVARHTLAIRAIYRAGGTIFYQDDPNTGYPASSKAFPYGEVARISLDDGAANQLEPWRLNDLPEMFDVLVGGKLDEDRLVQLAKSLRNHPGLQSANFHVPGLTNRGLQAIASIEVQSLLIGSTSFEHLDLGTLESNEAIEELWLQGPSRDALETLRPENAAALSRMPALARLYIGRLDLAAANVVEVIEDIDGLEWIMLSNTGLSTEQIAALEEEMPTTDVRVH